ncbi:VOC family protein [Streptosporangium canum]|uniref:VOC family protein n=1 Tax=Streptosporangium canum TaxID=324952 RepID=UPI00343A4B87
MPRTIHGFHHTGVLTRDLDGLEHRYTRLGFTLSPHSRHLLSARPGEPPVPGCTANRCALFGGSYIELLGIVDESAPDPWHTKAMADQYEGFHLLMAGRAGRRRTGPCRTAAALPARTRNGRHGRHPRRSGVLRRQRAGGGV